MGKTFGKIAKIGLIVAAVAVNVIPGVGTAISAALGPSLLGGVGLFGSIAGATAAATAAIGVISAIGVSTALGMLQKKPKVSASQLDRLNANISVDTPRKFVFGSTALPTDVRYQEWNGNDQDIVDQVLVLASHRICSVDQIWIEEKLAWTSTGGTQAKFVGYFFCNVILEATNGFGFTIEKNRWTPATANMVGTAQAHFRFKTTGNSKKAESPFSGGVPTRITIIGKAAPLPDPRFLTSAQIASQTGWAFNQGSLEIGTNPALALLFYLLGWRVPHTVTGEMKLVVGLGIPIERIDLDSFITAANMCDEPILKTDGTSEPRYRTDGVFSESDEPISVINSFEASMNAVLRDAGGRFSLQVLHNDLATPVIDFTEDDVLGDFTWTAGNALSERKNVVKGRYTDASTNSLYQLVDYPTVRLASLDGIDRVDTVDYALVESPGQAQRLAKQRLQRAQYAGTFSADFNAKGWAVKDGDIVRLRFPALGFDYKLFRIAQATVQVTGVSPLVLIEENAAIYAWDREEGAAVQAAVPNTFNPLLLPIVQAVAEAGETANWPQVTGEGRPEDGADVTGMHTAADTAAVAGVPSGQIIVKLSDIQQKTDDLEAIYGDTASAEQSANAAGAARDAANQALVNATARAQAADASAISAGGSATTASTKADQAGQSAQAAYASQIVAEGYADNSLSYANSSQASSVSAGQGAAAAQASASLAASIGPRGLNADPDFVLYSTPGTPNAPDKWVIWGTLTSIYRAPGRISPYAVVMNTVNGSNGVAADGGIYQGNSGALTTPLSGWFVLELDFKLEGGALPGLGLYAYNINGGNGIALECSTDPDTTGAAQGAGVVGKTYTFRKLVQIPNAPANGGAVFHLMQAWAGFGVASAPKITTVYHAAIRPATDAEIAARRADINASTALAQTASETSARVSADNAITTRLDTAISRIGVNEGSITDLYTTAANDRSSAAQATSTLRAYVQTAQNLCQDVMQWTTLAPGMTAYVSPYWGPIIAGNPAIPYGSEQLLAQSPAMSVAGAASYCSAADLLCFASAGSYVYADYVVVNAGGQTVVDSQGASAFANTDFSDTRPRSTFASTAYVPDNVGDGARAFVRLIGYVPTGGSVTAMGIRQAKFEKGQVPTAYTLEGTAAALTATVKVQSQVIADITGNKLKAFWQVLVDVGGTGKAGVVVTAQKADGTYTSAVDTYCQSFNVWNPAAGSPSDPNAYALALQIENGQATFYGTLRAQTVRASHFITDQGVDLAAIVPGSLNWKTAGAQALSGQSAKGGTYGPYAGTGLGTLGGHEVVGTATVTIRSAATSANAPSGDPIYTNVTVLLGIRIGNGAWQYIDAFTVQARGAGPAVSQTSTFTLTPPQTGPVQFAMGYRVENNGDVTTADAIVLGTWSINLKMASYK